MKLLLLYGVNCTTEIWNRIHPYFSNYEIDYVEYPHELTTKAKKVEDITEWVYEKYHTFLYDAVIGHSLGGIIALQLAAKYKMKFGTIVFLDTNLKPAQEFYRNIMTQEHLKIYGKIILEMFEEERKYYHKSLLESLQTYFDYTVYLKDIPQKIYGIYGDRGVLDYKNRISDLDLTEESLKKIDLQFIRNACHMIMVENPKELSETIKNILEGK